MESGADVTPAVSAHAYLRDLCANVGDLGSRPDLATALGRMALRIGDRLTRLRGYGR